MHGLHAFPGHAHLQQAWCRGGDGARGGRNRAFCQGVHAVEHLLGAQVGNAGDREAVCPLELAQRRDIIAVEDAVRLDAVIAQRHQALLQPGDGLPTGAGAHLHHIFSRDRRAIRRQTRLGGGGGGGQEGLQRQDGETVHLAGFLDAVGLLIGTHRGGGGLGVFIADGAVIMAQGGQRLVEGVDRVAIVPQLHGITIDGGQGVDQHALVLAVAHAALVDELLKLGHGDAGGPQPVFGLEGLQRRHCAGAVFAVDAAAVIAQLGQRLLQRAHTRALGAHGEGLIVDLGAGVRAQGFAA